MFLDADFEEVNVNWNITLVISKAIQIRQKLHDRGPIPYQEITDKIILKTMNSTF